MPVQPPVPSAAPPLPRWDDAATAGCPKRSCCSTGRTCSDPTCASPTTAAATPPRRSPMPDPLTGDEVDVLWVKGSGGDIGSMKMDGFATLYLDKLHALKRRYRGLAHEDEMVDLLPALHLQPEPARDQHRHAAALLHPASPRRSHARRRADRDRRGENGEALTREIFGDEIGWIPWHASRLRARPALRGAVPRPTRSMKGLDLRQPRAGHLGRDRQGVLRDDACASSSGRRTGWTRNGKPEPFGPQVMRAADGGARGTRSSPSSRPLVRGMLSARPRQGAALRRRARRSSSSSARRAAQELAAQGHDLSRSFPAHQGHAALRAVRRRARDAGRSRRRSSAALVEQYRQPTTPRTTSAASGPIRRRCAIRYPVLLLIPGLGLLAFQKDKPTARVAAEFFVNTINVMRWAEGVDEYVPIAEQEAFDIEYWLLEEAKLQRLPKPKALEGQDRAGHRRRRRHRRGDGAAAAGRWRARRADAISIRPRWTRRGRRWRKAHGADTRARRSSATCATKRRCTASMAYAVARVRRPRHPRVERRHRLGVADRRDDAGRRGSANIDILATGYFLVVARSLRA